MLYQTEVVLFSNRLDDNNRGFYNKHCWRDPNGKFKKKTLIENLNFERDIIMKIGGVN